MTVQQNFLIDLIKRENKEKVVKKVKVVINAGKASPAAPLGPILGQNRIKIKPFCDSFNSLTENVKPMNIPLKVEILILGDSTNFIKVKGIPLSFLLKMGVLDGSIKLSYLYKVLLFVSSYSTLKKRPVFNSILGTVRSSKLNVINDL